MNGVQIKAGIKKELMLIWRSFRLGGIILAFLGYAVYYPFNSKLTADLLENVDQTGTFMGESMSELMKQISDPFYTTVATLTGFSLIIALVLISAAAGGEQKKRSIIVPQTAGLTPVGYVVPKFLLYPPLMFVITFFATLTADAMCVLLTKTTREFELVALSGILTGVFVMFVTCFYLFLGISTVQPRLSVLYVYAANVMIAPLISGMFAVDKFTPWSLDIITNKILGVTDGINAVGADNIIITVIITLMLCVGFAFAALFAVTAKKTDNTADEVY